MTRFSGTLHVIIFLCLPLLFSSEVMAEPGMIHHDLNVRLEPDSGMLTVEDSILLPDGRTSELTFLLHSGMEPISPSPGVRITKTAEDMADVPVESFRVSLPEGLTRFVLRYKGEIHHPIESIGKETARGFSSTAGIISNEGVFLSGASYWYPRFGYDFTTFTLKISLPADWDAVSQGRRGLHTRRNTGTFVRWESREPQDEIYLIAARFKEYSRPVGNTILMAFLREKDDRLAEKYLDAAASYITMYESLIGPYPYGKFALVENFWETGYGMPSFTLLGPRIIRLPFIINSSYPHEILHNWWGNSVYPDWEKGNWSEGLTAYLSDHLIKEQQGSGAEYRQTTLQKYADYVLTDRDFPLTEFRSRHSSPSEAVGYGKSLMFFHMLRLRLGDEAFIEGLRDFYKTYRFRYASFDDMRKSFEKTSRKQLGDFFEQWVTMPGAPELKLKYVSAARKGDGFILSVRLIQAQRGRPYNLNIPVAITLENSRSFRTIVEMKKAEEEFNIRVPARPLRIDIDPEFDVFRRLDRREMPAAISQVLGSRKLLVILPGSTDKTIRESYKVLADAIAASGPDEVDTLLDKDITALPKDRAVVLLGWENRFLEQVVADLKAHSVVMGKEDMNIQDTAVVIKDHSFIFTLRHPDNSDMPLLFIASDSPDAVSGLGRKLPHYHKYSYLVFEGSGLENVVKGRWPVTDSPMTAFLPGKDSAIHKVEMAKLENRKPLISMPGQFSSERMMEVIRFLSSPRLEGRGLVTRGLDQAAEYIAAKFREAGLQPGGDNGGWFEEWQEKDADGRTIVMKNVIGVIPGKRPEFSGQGIVIGAHYDHLGIGMTGAARDNIGKIHPGADDNASGVAVLIELADVMKKNPPPDRAVIFAAFTGEEAGRKGSRHYVSKYSTNPSHKVMAMLNLDTVGRMQNNRLFVLGSSSSEEWPHILRGAGFAAGVDIQFATERLDSSDHVSFEEAGVPAIQFFTGPHMDYHRPTDTPDRINPEGLVKTALVAYEVIDYLARRQEFLTPSIAAAQPGGRPFQQRKVSIGTIPDFAHSGPGYRISGVVPGSPAEKAGLKEGDVIIEVSGRSVRGLKEFSDIIKTLRAGETVSIVFMRGKEEMTVQVVVSDR